MAFSVAAAGVFAPSLLLPASLSPVARGPGLVRPLAFPRRSSFSPSSSVLRLRASCRPPTSEQHEVETLPVPGPFPLFHSVTPLNGNSPSSTLEKNLLLLSAFSAPLLLSAQASFAADGEFGLLEGRSAALLHPAVMFLLFAASLYAAYSGFQWRRVRELGEQISTLKKSAPGDASDEEKASPVASEVAKLTEERKALVAGGFRDKHWATGSWLLAAGVGIAVEGCVNTYLRTGRLFPGPHLYAGAAITVLWAAAAALVPSMQKGNDAARSLHIGLNSLNILLFISQIPTGLEIVGKVFEFTTWP